MTNEMIQFWNSPRTKALNAVLQETSDSPVTNEAGLPHAERREVRTIDFKGQICVVLYDLARCLEIDRKRLVKALQGRARLVDAIDVDGAERILIVVPAGEMFHGFRTRQPSDRTD